MLNHVTKGTNVLNALVEAVNHVEYHATVAHLRIGTPQNYDEYQFRDSRVNIEKHQHYRYS